MSKSIPRIVGVRYVGKRAEMQDSILKTGAVWLSGQVLNFSLALAKKLFTHSDVWQPAPVDYNEATYLSMPSAGNPEPVAMVNLARMNGTQLRNFSRLEFNTPLPDDMSETDARKSVLQMMHMKTLDEVDEHVRGNVRHMVPYPLTEDEYAALMSGVVELRLVPARAEQDLSVQEPPTIVPIVEQLEPPTEAPTETDPIEPQGEAAQVAQTDAPTLPELLASLDLAGLKELAKENGVSFSKSWTAAVAREKLLAALSK